jgi:predicted RNA binding protein YcfA (HicA-like mRNA interferase family)
MSHEVKPMLKKLKKQGWYVEKGRSGHWKCFPPGSKHACTVAATPSDYRSWLNDRAALRRRGARL